MTRNAENFSAHQFHSNLSLNISVDAGMNHHQSEIKLRFSCPSVGAKPEETAPQSMTFDNVDFCKKEPHDDSQDPSTVDDTQDLINFDDDGLCDFLDGIEGELPADIFQVLNQGELDNMDFHDSPLNIKDSLLDTAPDQPISSATPVPSVLLHTNSSNGEFKASSTSNDNKGPSPSNQFSSSVSGSQISLNVEIAQSLVTDAGPAAETLKQMAARRSHETSTKASSYTQNQQQAPLQTYSYTIPYAVSDYALSTSMAAGQNLAQQARYRMPSSLNSTSTQLSALQSCLPGKHEQQNAYCPPYGAGSGFGIKQSRSRIRNACAASLSTMRYPGIGSDVSLQFCVRSQSSQIESPAQFSMLQNEQTLVPSNDANNFNPGHMSISTTQQQQQFFYQPVQNSSTTNVVRSYLQAINRNVTVNPHPGQQHLSTYPASQYVSTASRIQAGGQMFVNKNMMKIQSNAASQQLELPLSSTIKMEVGMTGCSPTNGQAFNDSTANSTSLPLFRNSTSQSDYISQGYTQPGVFGSVPNVSNIMRSSTPSLYLKSSSSRTLANTANSNVFSLQQGSQLGSWLQAPSLQSPSLGMEPSLNTVPPPHRSPQFTGYRQIKPPTPQAAYAIHGDVQQQQQQHAPRLPMRGWGYSELRMPQGYAQLGNDATHLTSDGTQTNVRQARPNAGTCGSGMLPTHSGQRSGVVTVQGQHAGNGNRPPVGQMSSSGAGQFMLCNDTSALFDSPTIQNHESLELSLIEDFINGK